MLLMKESMLSLKENIKQTWFSYDAINFYKQILTAVGFEPTPPNRLVPKTR